MENTNPPNQIVNYLFLLEWVLANLVGLPALLLPYGIGYFLLTYLVIMGGGIMGPIWYVLIVIILILSAALSGMWLGFMQWFSLKGRIPQSRRWIGASCLGVGIGVPFSWLVYGLFLMSGIVFPYMIFGVLLGLTIGVAQWSVLRQQVDGAGWWIFILPGCFTLSLFYFFQSSVPTWFRAITVLIGIGCFTGILLSLLLQFPKLQRNGQ